VEWYNITSIKYFLAPEKEETHKNLSEKINNIELSDKDKTFAWLMKKCQISVVNMPFTFLQICMSPVSLLVLSLFEVH
jgi:spore coat polysaccharide biosynthesis predicted glycosyltransferase SpsG